MNKNVIFFLLFLFYLSIINIKAQEKGLIRDKEKELLGFLNFKWGDSKKKVKTEMLKRQSVTFDEEEGNILYFTYGKFAEENVNTWGFSFYNNKLARASVRFDYKTMDDCTKLFWRLDFSMIDKYGFQASMEKAEYPLLGGKITWEFKTNGILVNTIWLILTEDSNDSFNVQLHYFNNELDEKVDSEERNKQKKEL